jgi:nitrile hydratase
LAKDVQKTLGWGGPSLRSTKNEPIYKIGDDVITLKHNPNKDIKGGHTRLPTYAMGKMGKVYSYNGSHVLPDTNAHGNGETPTPLYTIEFKAIELWGTSAENENDLVYLDLWEPYFTLNTE